MNFNCNGFPSFVLLVLIRKTYYSKSGGLAGGLDSVSIYLDHCRAVEYTRSKSSSMIGSSRKASVTQIDSGMVNAAVLLRQSLAVTK